MMMERMKGGAEVLERELEVAGQQQEEDLADTAMQAKDMYRRKDNERDKREKYTSTDAVKEASNSLVDLAAAQGKQEEKAAEARQLSLQQLKEAEDALLSACAEKVRAAVERSLELTIELHEELVSLEEEKMLARCLTASNEAVDEVFEARRKKLIKRMEALAESSKDGEEQERDDSSAELRHPDSISDAALRNRELEEINELHLREREVQAVAVREKFDVIKRERLENFVAMLRAQREALGVCIENAYGVKLPSEAGLPGEMSSPTEETKRLIKVQDRISSFFKRLLQHSLAGAERAQRSKDMMDAVMASWPAFAEQIVRDADEDRRIKRESEDKMLRQQRRSRKKVRMAESEPATDEDEALGDKEVAISVLLRQADEKRQEGETKAALFDLSTVTACGGVSSSRCFEDNSEQAITTQCDEALRKLETTLKRAAMHLRAEYEADMEAIKHELKEAHASADRQAEMDKSRVEVETNLKAACAETEEEKTIVHRESKRMLEKINDEVSREKAAQEARAQEKMSARSRLFQQQRKQLEEEADLEETKTRHLLQRRLAALKKEENEAAIEFALQEARAETSGATVKRLHEALVAPLNETINSMVSSHLEEKARRLNEITSKMRQEYEQDRATAEADFDAQIREAEEHLATKRRMEGEDFDDTDMCAKLDSLRDAKDQTLQEKESNFSFQLEYALQVERVALEPPQAEELLKKQEESADHVIRILQEFADIGDKTAIFLVNQARQAKKHLDAERQRVREAAGIRLLDIHRVMKEKEEELRKRFALAVDARKRSLELQREREKEQLQKAHEEEMRRRREMQRARQQRQLRFLASKNKADDPDSKEALFRQHEEETRQYEEALQRDRARQLVALQQRLQKKNAQKGVSKADEAAQRQLEKERARLIETEKIAASAEKERASVEGKEKIDKAEEERMYKFMFALEIETEACKRANRLHAMLTEILKKLQQGDSIIEETSSSPNVTEDLNAVFQKLETLMEAVKNQEDSVGPA